MTDTSIFNNSESQTNTQSNESNDSQLINTQSKYSSWNTEDLVKKAEAADAHINKLETENSDYRKNDATLQEVLQKLDQSNAATSQNNPSTNTNQYQERSNSSETVSKEDIEKLVSISFDRKQQESLAKRNVETVRTELKKVWGDNYSQKLTERAQELGVEQSYLESTAENYPQVFLKVILGENSTSNPNTHVAPTSTQTSPVLTTPGNFTRYKDFSKMMKEKPELLSDPMFNRQMHEAAQKYGKEFYNN